MKQTIVGIFAHPDDEAFGPGGTLAVLSKTNDVYIICVTDGDAQIGEAKSKNKNIEDLGEVRKNELQTSAKILGIKEVFFLGFHDGTLSNNLYHDIAVKIETILQPLHPDILITYEQRGVSGHLDHIAVSMITTYIFEKRSYGKELWYFAAGKEAYMLQKNYFIYFPEGYKKEDVDKVVDTKDVWEIKKQAMVAHTSQLHDVKKVLAAQEKFPKEEYFLVHKK